MTRPSLRTDDQFAAVDVAAAIAAGLRSPDPARQLVTGCAAPAAAQAARAGVLPGSLTFLAEIVRRGGIGYAAQLPEPLPTPEQSALIRPWLGAAAATAGADEAFARWLDAVATVVDARATGR